ncbi:CatA-like O-acetyltransferase [Flammeovirga kamogawensis]|uniref:Chloramphenicol acetyltransferase n=1 Tax=Flammeovirga kamogawensis TaxID=373891 RepID=A0ABX8H2B7_9BACT|nr:CatA-like O-acetyltransferase [Flammeovirga kamogawensis]MBB6462426.1 chloramphenicol O-acetyltransferase [Flammeovirga kamogawensis]QWG09537.1 hypothetical protein KM029_23300 [Flammeovirga kamogawensis]TRX65053.1 hypothetical protein EO216_21200 [Flammeovirga kamogawensis]
MDLSTLLEKFDGKKLEMTDVSSYEQWSLNFFHDKNIVREPNLQMTLQLDVTKGLEFYASTIKKIDGASFSSYLMWCLVQAMKEHPYFRYRMIEGEWYIFDNLPVFCPVAVGGDKRFTEILVENPAHSTIEEFIVNYRNKIKQAFNKDGDFAPLPPTVWASAHFIGNLPNLQFTSFQLHTSALDSARPFFYFGKRYEQNGQSFIPLSITFDHSNLDPFVLSNFMADFEKVLIGD